MQNIVGSCLQTRKGPGRLPVDTTLVEVRAADRPSKSEIAFPRHHCYYNIYINRADIIIHVKAPTYIYDSPIISIGV